MLEVFGGKYQSTINKTLPWEVFFKLIWNYFYQCEPKNLFKVSSQLKIVINLQLITRIHLYSWIPTSHLWTVYNLQNSWLLGFPSHKYELCINSRSNALALSKWFCCGTSGQWCSLIFFNSSFFFLFLLIIRGLIYMKKEKTTALQQKDWSP